MGTEVAINLTALFLVSFVFFCFVFLNSKWGLVIFFLWDKTVYNYYMSKFGVGLQAQICNDGFFVPSDLTYMGTQLLDESLHRDFFS